MNRNLKDSYKKYKETSDDLVDIKTYIEINSLYNKFLIKKALEGHEVTLPARLGMLSVVGRIPTIKFDEEGHVQGLAPDWVSTKKLWDENPEAKSKKTLLYHTNNHTGGYRYKWNWNKNKVLVENKTLYALRLTRENKRVLHRMINQGTQFITK